MRYHFRNAYHFVASTVTDGLTPEAKLDIQNYINERKVDETGGTMWDSVKWVVYGVLGLSMICGLIYCIYQCFKSKNAISSGLQVNPIYGGGYTPNLPVSAGNQVYATPSSFQYQDAQSRVPRGNDANFAQSVTWHLNTSQRAR